MASAPATRSGLDVFGRTRRVHVAATVGAGQVGTLADSPIVVGSLPFVQELTGLGERVTHILVTPRAGRGADAREALQEIAADRLDVVPADNESRLINQAAGPNEQSTGMFAAISMVVGDPVRVQRDAPRPSPSGAARRPRCGRRASAARS